MPYIPIRPLLSLIAPLVLFYAGCEKNPLGIVDVPKGSAPVVTSVTVTPDTLEVIPDPITFHVRVLTNDADGANTVAEVAASLLDEQGVSLAESILARAGEGFEGSIISSQRLQQGKHYAVVISARDDAGFRSSAARHSIAVIGPNAPPTLGIPGIRQLLQAGDSLYLLVAVAVRDTNGLSTVTSVTVRGIQTTDPATRPMFDDGRRNVTGDVAAGDGIYTALLWVRPSGTPQQLGMEVTAVDRSGGRASTTRFMMNQPPAFASIDVPDRIQRPVSGATTVTFRATVTDPDGISDIDSVYFRNLSSANPAIVLMYDDGNLPAHGDSVASDGRYARVLSIDATTTTGDKEFHFYAVDRAGARAEQVRIITIQ